MIVVRMSERQQIVLLTCEVGRYVCLGLGWDGGLKKKGKKTSFLDDMMTFSGAHQKQLGWGDRERGVQATDRASLLLALLPKKIFVCVC